MAQYQLIFCPGPVMVGWAAGWSAARNIVWGRELTVFPRLCPTGVENGGWVERGPCQPPGETINIPLFSSTFSHWQSGGVFSDFM